MIRKFGHVSVSPEVVRSIFCDVEKWPEWQAGLNTVTLLDRTDTTIEFEATGRFMGHRMHGIFDCRIEPEGFFQNQRSGWLKRWTNHWHFATPPDGRGTTVICEIDMDTGLIGAFVPKSFVKKFVNRIVNETIVNLDGYAEELLASTAPAPSPRDDTETLLEIFDTPAGYEILVGGRRISLDSREK